MVKQARNMDTARAQKQIKQNPVSSDSDLVCCWHKASETSLNKQIYPVHFMLMKTLQFISPQTVLTWKYLVNVLYVFESKLYKQAYIHMCLNTS